MEAGEITGMLAGWRGGDRAALERLLPLIRTELHRLARRHLARERKDHSMQPSSLVQEAFLRLIPGVDAGWRDRVHFFAVRFPSDAAYSCGLRAAEASRETWGWCGSHTDRRCRSPIS